MGKRKRYLRGKVYKTNDRVFSRDGYAKSGRRVVALNNDPNNLHVVKIKSLYDKSGRRRNNLIEIERYNFLTKKSGIHPKIYDETAWGVPIRVQRMGKSYGRLNKWDLWKIKHLR